MPHRVIAVSTNRQVDEAVNVLLSIGAGVVERLGGAPANLGERLTLVDRAHGVTRDDLDSVRGALRECGIVAADHYGPATLTEVARAARAPAAATVVWWHTGGVLELPRLLDMLVGSDA